MCATLFLKFFPFLKKKKKRSAQQKKITRRGKKKRNQKPGRKPIKDVFFYKHTCHSLPQEMIIILKVVTLQHKQVLFKWKKLLFCSIRIVFLKSETFFAFFWVRVWWRWHGIPIHSGWVII